MTHLVHVKLISQINKKTFDATVSWEVRIETLLWVARLILKLVDGINLTFVIWHQWTEQAFLLLPTPSLSCLCPWICECLMNESLLMLYYILLFCSGGDCSLKFKNLMTEISKSPKLWEKYYSIKNEWWTYQDLAVIVLYRSFPARNVGIENCSEEA